MKKIFYISQCPLPHPNLDLESEVGEFIEKFIHLPFIHQTNAWYEKRFNEAIDAFNSQRDSIGNDLFNTGGKMRLKRDSILWIRKIAHIKIKIDLLEGMEINNSESTPIYNQKFIEKKILKLEGDLKLNTLFPFHNYANRFDIANGGMVV